MKKLIYATATVAMLAAAMPAFAMSGDVSATTNSSAAIACVGAAVNTREQALAAGVSAHASAVSTAYATRASALQAAYALTDAKSVRTAVKAAWSAFSKSVKEAGTTWRTARNKAWTDFRTAAKACKAPASVSDSTMSGSEVSGQ